MLRTHSARECQKATIERTWYQLFSPPLPLVGGPRFVADTDCQAFTVRNFHCAIMNVRPLALILSSTTTAPVIGSTLVSLSNKNYVRP